MAIQLSPEQINAAAGPDDNARRHAYLWRYGLGESWGLSIEAGHRFRDVPISIEEMRDEIEGWKEECWGWWATRSRRSHE